MATGPPASTVETIPSASLGQSRGRSHGRFHRSSQPPALALSPAEPTLDTVPQSIPVTEHPSGNGLGISHGHSHTRSLSFRSTSPLRSALFDGANGSKTGGILGQPESEPDTPVVQSQEGDSSEMVVGLSMAAPWVALSWYSAYARSPDGSSVGNLPGIAGRTCIMAAATMLMIGGGQIMQLRQNGKAPDALPEVTLQNAGTAFVRACAVGLPIFAALKVGGFLVAFVILLASAAGVPTAIDSGAERFGQRKLTITVLGTAIVLGYFGFNTAYQQPFLGYVGLLVTAFVVRPSFAAPGEASASGTVGTDASINVITGIALLFPAIFLSESLGLSGFDSISLLAIASIIAGPLVYLDLTSIRSPGKFGLAVGTAAAALLSAPPARDGVFIAYVARTILAGLSFLTARFEDRHLRLNAHTHHAHTGSSKVTKMVLQYSEPYPLLHSILQESDSRRIFYFMSLNFAFMLVQLSYGFLTGSLGLLSDSIHMFFDCLALVVGLCAAVMSKWPPSARFPYGYGKVDTLSGFANGIFLMIISLEIIYEAVERLTSGSEMHRIGELLAVSMAGLAVNLVGIFAFEHGHGHGHDHGHGHSHGNENMHGIFLHILADTLGSVAVVISTVLVHYTGWSGFDPIASCMIAILIFASAIPLVSSTAKSLLLTLPAGIEYNVRDTLAGVSTLRGVVGYTVPKFWLDDTATSSAHDHAHGHVHHHHHHSHDHACHTDSHDHTHENENDHHHHHHHHDHDHDHDHDHIHPNVLGVIHILASRGSDLEDVHQRSIDFLRGKGMDILVQVEREGDGRCWCGGGNNNGNGK